MFYKHVKLAFFHGILGENLETSSGFHLIFCPDISIATGSNSQDQTSTNVLSYFHIHESNLLSSTIIATENKTLMKKLKTSLARDSIINNSGSDNEKSDTEVINQDNPEIINEEEMAIVIPNSQ